MNKEVNQQTNQINNLSNDNFEETNNNRDIDTGELNNEETEKSKSLFKNSIFTDEQIDKMSKEFLPLGQFLSLSFKVMKNNLWKAFLRPLAYTFGIITFLLALIITVLAMLISRLDDGLVIGSIALLIVTILTVIILINFGIRSLLVLKNPNHDFLSKEYKVSKYFWSLVVVLLLINSIIYGLGIFIEIPIIGFLIGLVLNVLIILFLSNATYMTVFENQKPIENIEKSFELAKNRFNELIPRSIVITFIPFVYILINLVLLVLYVLSLRGNTPFFRNFNAFPVFPLIFIVILPSLLFVVISFIFNIYYTSLTVTNYANLRLAPKPNRDEKFYNEFKSKIPLYIIVFVIILCLIIGGLNPNTQSTYYFRNLLEFLIYL